VQIGRGEYDGRS